MLADEAKVLQRVAEADLDEFIRTFWARRNPGPAPADNPFRAAVEKARAEADARFSDVGKKGSETACGQIVMLLGNPDEVTGRELQNIFDTRPSADSRYRRPDSASRNATRDGARRPELWTFKSNASRTFRMSGGDLRLQFDDGCEFDEGARTLDELARLAAERVVHPEIRYQFGAEGRLKPLAEPAQALSSARAVLVRPRADFDPAFEPKIQVPGHGGAYHCGDRKGARAPCSVHGPRTSQAACGGAGDAGLGRGRPARGTGRLRVRAGGRLVRDVVRIHASAGAVLGGHQRARPSQRSGRRDDLAGRVARLRGQGDDRRAARGADRQRERPGTGACPATLYAAFAIGADRLAPRPGNVLSQAESLRLLVFVHNATLDPVSARAALRAAFTVLQDGKVIARGKDQTFDTGGAAPSVGPIPLAPFAPGRYLARVEITDEVAKTSVVRETPFEVAPPGQPH